MKVAKSIEGPQLQAPEPTRQGSIPTLEGTGARSFPLPERPKLGAPTYTGTYVAVHTWGDPTGAQC